MAASAFSAAEVEGSVPARFARVVAARGDALAIVADDQHLTYRELDRRSDALAATAPQTSAVSYCTSAGGTGQ